MDFLASEASPIRLLTTQGADPDVVFDIHGIIQQSHLEVDWANMHDVLKPQKGTLGLQDYQKAHAPVLGADQDIFDLRGIDRGADALVVVRPDQYVSLVLPLDGFDELTKFFTRFMIEPA
tara:strand:- start:222 stop:581 length:360 start_codon:yes stop_codon:yes gene_type:complete